MKQLELAQVIGKMTETEIEQLAEALYSINADCAVQLMRDIGIMDMESIIDQREGVAV